MLSSQQRRNIADQSASDAVNVVPTKNHYMAILAKTIEEEKMLVSLRYFPLCDDIMTMQAKASALSTLQTDATILQRATYLLWIAQKLEQISGYTASMRKRIIYIAEA